MKIKNAILIVFSSLFGAGLAIGFNQYFNNIKANEIESKNANNFIKPVLYNSGLQPVNFTGASSVATPAVVHVNTSYTISNQNSQQFYGDDIFQYFFGPPQYSQPRESKASGSGVIVSEDGYIITNNHVIENANDIQVNLSNNKTYKAKLIGADRDTDLALIKIEEKGLPFLNFADSDSVLVGEWVLAVGNPFNLASTVTAGIVSAKGRNINILENVQGQSNTAIESFIQTDAAINPGNSGGALVNTKGELIGINTAIATPTGTYAGYAFAVPSNIAYKVMKDLKNFGTVQRAFLGVNILSVDSKIAEELNLEKPEGVYIQSKLKGGSADEAGLKVGDVIIGIDGEKVINVAELQEKISSYSPGNVIEVSIIRNNTLYNETLTLKNKFNEEEVVLSSTEILNSLGLKLKEANPNDLISLNLKNGIKVVDIVDNGWIDTYTDMRKNFIITMVNDVKIATINDFLSVMNNKRGNVLIEGKYPNNENTFLYALKIE